MIPLAGGGAQLDQRQGFPQVAGRAGVVTRRGGEFTERAAGSQERQGP